MTKTYRISSRGGVVFGDYDATGPLAALDAMSRDAGYRDHADACATTGDEPSAWTESAYAFAHDQGFGLLAEEVTS